MPLAKGVASGGALAEQRRSGSRRVRWRSARRVTRRGHVGDDPWGPRRSAVARRESGPWRGVSARAEVRGVPSTAPPSNLGAVRGRKAWERLTGVRVEEPPSGGRFKGQESERLPAVG